MARKLAPRIEGIPELVGWKIEMQDLELMMSCWSQVRVNETVPKLNTMGGRLFAAQKGRPIGPSYLTGPTNSSNPTNPRISILSWIAIQRDAWQ